MKRLSIFMLLLALIAPWAAMAQETQTVEIGTDGGTTNNNYLPGYTLYDNTLSEQIYTAEEVTMAGTISSVAFYNGGSVKSPTVTLYMVNTDKEAFETTSDWLPVTSADLVFEGSVTFTAGAWTTITLDTPFDYDGESNLGLVAHVHMNQYSSGLSCRVFTSTSNCSMYAYRDNTVYNPTNPGVTGSRLSVKNQIKLEITPSSGPHCEKPETLVADRITAHEATLTWEGGSGEYNVELNGEIIESNWRDQAYTLRELDAATNYTVRVQSVCSDMVNPETGDPMVSGWKAVGFTTPCEAITTYPWTENFDSYTGTTSGSTNNLPQCYNYINGTTYSYYAGYPVIYNSSSNSNSGNNHLYLYSYYSSSYNYTPIYAILPEMEGLNGKQLTLYARAYNTSSSFTVGMMTDPEDASTFVAIDTKTPSSTTAYEEFTFTLGEGNYVAIMMEAANSSSYYRGIRIDDIMIDNPPTCAKPTDLQHTGSTTTTATLSWTNGSNDQTAWQICLNGNENNLIMANSNPFTIENLDASSTYTAKVRAYCSETDQSYWSNEIGFATECDVISTLPWSENFDTYTGSTSASAPTGYPNDQLPNCWQFLNRSDNSSSYPQVFISSNSGYPVSGNCLFFKSSSTTPLYAILPGFAEEIAGLQLTFTYRNEGTTASNGTLIVGYMTDPADATTFTEVLTCDRTTTKTEKEVLFADAPTGSYIAFEYQGGSANNYYLGIDNVSVDYAPSCPKPQSLAVTANSVTAHGATVTWTEAGEATQWIVEFATDADFTDVLNETVNDEPTYTFHGLDPETTYYVRVKAHCGAGNESQYSNVVNFTTDAACKVPTSLTVTNLTATTATLSWTESGESTAWQICLNNDEEHLTDIDTDDVTINEGVVTYQLGDLTSATAYTAKVRGICNNEPTDWSNVASFTTLQVAVNLPYSNDFESGNDWLLVNGNLTNAWAYGTATSNGEGTHALYISNDGGTTNAYTLNSAAMVYATKLFNFEAGTYVFSYDWKANGESTYDYLRVALVPASVQLAAGTSAPSVPSGSFYNNLPTGWIALDGGGKLNLSSDWQSFASNEMEIAAGTYMMVFAWRDDTSGGSQPPAAIDNVSIEKITCTTPANLTINENSITNNSVEFSWTETGEATAWQICLNGDESNLTDIDTDDVTINEGVVTYQLTDLTSETAYTVKVRANCDADNQSGWSNEASFTTKSNCATPDGLNVTELTDNSAKLNWNGVQESYNVRYREVITPDVNFNVTYDFEDGMQGWTFSDEDGDGNCWAISSSSPHGGSQCVRATYNFNDVPLNWLISPEIPLGGTLSFYAKRYSNGTGEQFQVFVSSTGTDISNFTPITDVIDATTTYELYEYSLSNYSGNGYVAIKHTAEVNQWYLDVDDITITNITQGEYGAWNTSNTNVTSGLTINGLTPLTMYEWQVQGINAGCDGGVTDWSEAATFTTPITKHIIGYNSAEGNGNNYYLIASPLADAVAPTTVGGMITDELGAEVNPETSTYDLYSFDESEDLEWINYRGNENDFSLVNGQAYLYASKNGTTLTFTGVPYSGDTKEVTLQMTENENADFQGWNLVGNPFAEEAYIEREYFYVMDGNGAEIIAEENTSRALQPMEGIFVVADHDGEEITFTKQAPGAKANIVLNLGKGIGNTIDRAIVGIGQGRTLPKFMLNPNNTKLYIPQNGKDYAVVRSRVSDEVPVNFLPTEDGYYNISVDVRNMNLRSLVLKDKVRNVSIDLLRTPNYMFKASAYDRADRFVLSFKNGNGIYKEKLVKGANPEDFSFYSNGVFVIDNEGEATLQVIDLNGRVLSSENIYGSASIQVDVAPGVYMLRLINGDNVKVQKVVVK